ncbi:MAG: NifU family protein [Fusobacterium sp.]|nr:NifU family protein [Fusobacterium sp.]
MEKIQEVLEKEIFPYLNDHGGSIELESYDEMNKDLQLRLMGQCCTCPHSIDTIDNLIKIKLWENFPEIKNIQVNSGVSNELFDFAKNLLRKN